MPIPFNDIRFYLSGGLSNMDPLLSVGGDRSSTLVSEATDTLFPSVQDSEALSGGDTLRCIYIRNENSSLPLNNARVWLGLDEIGQAKVSIALTEDGEFLTPGGEGPALLVGDLAPEGAIALWIKRTVPAHSAPKAETKFRLTIKGESI